MDSDEGSLTANTNFLSRWQEKGGESVALQGNYCVASKFLHSALQRGDEGEERAEV